MKRHEEPSGTRARFKKALESVAKLAILLRAREEHGFSTSTSLETHRYPR
jgi:hypothetical protein